MVRAEQDRARLGNIFGTGDLNLGIVALNEPVGYSAQNDAQYADRIQGHAITLAGGIQTRDK